MSYNPENNNSNNHWMPGATGGNNSNHWSPNRPARMGMRPASNGAGGRLPRFADAFPPGDSGFQMTPSFAQGASGPALFNVHRDQGYLEHQQHGLNPYQGYNSASNTILPQPEALTSYRTPASRGGDISDDSMPDANSIVSWAHASTSVVGGSRRAPTAKSKDKRITSKVMAHETKAVNSRRHSSPPPKKQGRSSGNRNYSSDDVDPLLDAVEEVLPMGQNSWNDVADHFNAWVSKSGWPARDGASLKLKFTNLVKTTKPTGDPECPPELERAYLIDALILEKAGAQDPDDNEDFMEVSSDNETENVAPRSKKNISSALSLAIEAMAVTIMETTIRVTTGMVMENMAMEDMATMAIEI
ncbi:hypothetical protein C8J56DRAFT_894899 [Mycena floridula]|nr:hypothetical protein C8J56DRAFT_894899 [Mycena floridula]